MSDAKRGIRSSVNVTKEGPVLKLAGFLVKTWEDRWFRLRGRQLLYYKSELDTQFNAPRQILNLRGAKIFRAAEGKISAPNDLCIEIQLIEPQMKSYYFCTKSEEDLEDWMKHLEAASKYKFEAAFALRGHDAATTLLTFSGKGSHMLSGSVDGSLKVWDLVLCKLLTNMEGHRLHVTSGTYCDMGRKIVTASEDHTIKVWDSSSYLLIRTMQEFLAPVSVCIASPGEAKVIAAASHDGAIKLWDTVNLQFIAKLNGHTQRILFMKFSGDGKKLVSVSIDGLVQFWNVPNFREPIASSSEASSAVAAAFSSSGTFVAVATADHSVYLWDWSSPHKPLHEIKAHMDSITGLVFLKHSLRLITASRDKSLNIWDLNSGKSLGSLATEYPVSHVRLSPTGQLLVAVNGPVISVWHAETFEPLSDLPHDSPVTLAEFSPEGSKLICSLEDNSLKVWGL